MGDNEKKTIELTDKQVADIELAAARAVAGLTFVAQNTGSKANQVVLGETVGGIVAMTANLLGFEKEHFEARIKTQLDNIKSEMAGASLIDKPQNALPC